MKWVRQEDANGCGIATLAMICERSYAEVKATVDSWKDGTTLRNGECIPTGKPNDWAKWGCTHYTLDRYLAFDGWYLQRRYDAWDELPKEPFASIHYANVEQPSRQNHFVVVLADGDVLDPTREGRFSLTDWSKVNQLVGLQR